MFVNMLVGVGYLIGCTDLCVFEDLVVVGGLKILAVSRSMSGRLIAIW